MAFLGNIFALVLGIVLVVKGGDAFVEAAGNLARRLGLPAFLVGATVVSLATTLPEMMVSVLAACQGKTEMAIGNALGSVTANTGLIFAIAMAVMPGVTLPGLTIPGLLLLGTGMSLWAACGGGELAFWGVILLIGICAAFLVYNARRAAKHIREETDNPAAPWLWKFLLGAVGIVAGSQLLVNGGSGLARSLGVPEGIIAATLLAVGTSLPELVTSLAAIRKGELALSVGNIIGANIIDLTLILPLCSLASGKGLSLTMQNLSLDLPVCVGILAVAVLPLLVTKKSSRIHGVLLLLLYGCYILCLI